VETIYLGLGSNLGDRDANIDRAIKLLGQNKVIINKVATVIETDPIGGPPQGKFLNTVLCAETTLKPHELLNVIQLIEKQLGRLKKIINGPRPIDIDILLYGQTMLKSPELIIPHPRMTKRAFVMQPLLEIAPELFNDNTIYHSTSSRYDPQKQELLS